MQVICQSFLISPEDVDKVTLLQQPIEVLCIKMRTDQNIKGYKLDTLETLLSLYADDCSIFLEYDSNNLENTITVLDDFYQAYKYILIKRNVLSLGLFLMVSINYATIFQYAGI